MNNRFEELRRRIERAGVETPDKDFVKLSSDELIHEISVYHAELLAQNEELEHAAVLAQDQAAANTALFEAAPVAYFIVTERGAIERANGSGTELLKEFDFSIGSRLASLYADIDSRFSLWLLNWSDTAPKSLRVKQTERWHQLTKARFTDDRVLITVTDITELLRSRERYQDVAATLKQERAKLMQGLAVLAHELRTPLASMRMMMDEQKIASQEPYGSSLVSSTDHVLNVLDDLQVILDPNESKHYARRVEAPYALTERVMTSLRFVFKENGIATKLVADKYAAKAYEVPVQAVRQILTNLLKNAAVHSEGSQIRIRLSIENPDSDKPILDMQVTDDGVGIAQEKLESMFGVFERGDKHRNGTGLGLYASRQIATSLGGRLVANSILGQGAAFIVQLPVSPAQVDADAVTKAEQVESVLNGARILLADDDQFQRMLMKKYLESLGAVVAEVEDGAVALEVLEQQEFDLLVSDLNMPNLDGLDLLRELRLIGKRLDSLILTGGTDPDTRQRLKSLGAIDVLHKPVTAADIALTVANHRFS